MRRFTMLALACALAAPAGCGKKDEKTGNGTGDEPTPTPVETTDAAAEPAAADPIEAYTAYLAAYNERDEEALGAAFADGVELTLAGASEPMVGPDEIVTSSAETWSALPDTRLEPQIIVADGREVAALLLGHGTHTGPMQTPAGELAPTEAETGSLGIEIVEIDDAGRITSGTQYWDIGLLLAQMLGKKGTRPAQREGADSPTVVPPPAEGPAGEPAARHAKAMAAYAAGEIDARMELYADGAVLYHSLLPEDLEGKQAIQKFLRSQREAFSDMKIETTGVVRAGPYEFSQNLYTGTNTGPFPPLTENKTGKSLEIHVGRVLEFDPESGKVKREWVVANSLSLMEQLGVDPTK